MKALIYVFLFTFCSVFSLSAQITCTDPTPEILGDLFVCQDETATYQVDTFTAGNTYDFDFSGGGDLTIVDGEVTIDFDDDPGTYVLTLTESTPDGCSGTAFFNIVIEGDIVLICNDNLNISLANDCELEITYDIILEAPKYDEDSYTITVRDEDGNIVPNIIDHNYINQTLEVSIMHDCSGNVCWGDITVEDKLRPVIACENDTISCDEYQNFIPTAMIVSDNCQDAVLDYTIDIQELTCDLEFSRILEVTFTAIDGSGNTAIPCTSLIYVEKESIMDIDLPLNYDGLPGSNPTISCSANFPTTSQGFPSPEYTGFPGGLNDCSSIEWTFTDISIPICDVDCDTPNPSFKVIREWTIVDWCTGEIVDRQQILKVEDKEAPVIAPVADITANANPFDCSAQVLLPVTDAVDNCSAQDALTYEYSSSVGTIVNGVLFLEEIAKTMPGDEIEVTISVSDCCGNTATETFLVTIVDNTPPVVVADSHETISLLPTGSATMFATSLDDGSYDNCGPIAFGVRRMDSGAGNPSIDLFPPAGNDNGQYNEVVHFFCSDVQNGPVMVQFRVCDDADMDGTIGNGNDNCNIAMIEVNVQDKYEPVILCPDDMTISCLDFEGVDVNDMAQLNALFGTVNAVGTCNVEVTQTVTGTDELNCGVGFIARNFTATNSAGSESCTQQISVVAFEDNLLTCDRISFEGLNNSIYNWCAINDNVNDDDDDLPAINIDGCEGINVAEVELDIAGLCTTAAIQVEIDTFSYPGSSACKKYIVHYEVIDQCVFDENFVNVNTGQIDPFHSDNGYFEFYLEYNVVDTGAPELICSDVTVSSEENCDGFTGVISIEAMDACTPSDQLFYEYKIDLNADGFVDLPTGGNYFSGNGVSAGAIGMAGIPAGNHIILWKVNDGCGNVQTCAQNVTVTPETKKPTPYCYGDLSTAVMPINGMINIWANDFDAGSEDNCSALTFSMIPVQDVEGMDSGQAYAQSFNHPNVTISADGDLGFQFDCSYLENGVFGEIEIRIYVTDAVGNYDFCTAFLRIDDNEDVCPNSTTGMITVSGNINTKKGEGIEGVNVEIFTDLVEFPLYEQTNEAGLFGFADLQTGMDYEVTPEKNDDHLAGITALDIVLIQKHILGISQITDPYILIAADVNSDCQINGLDIVQLRKLLLGKYVTDELPQNQSWRFVDIDQDLSMSMPCDYKESIVFDDMLLNGKADFVGVKIGDINESLEFDAQQEAETRTAESLELFTTQRVYDAGDIFTINFYSDNFTDISGFQLAINHENMEIVEVIPAVLDITEDHINRVGQQASIVYTNPQTKTIGKEEVLFSWKVRTINSGTISADLAIDTRRLSNEAYVGHALNIADVKLEVRTDLSEMNNESFMLYQNEPNPFNGYTKIGFYTGESSTYVLSVYDLTGRKILEKSASFASGDNAFIIENGTELPQGILYYTVQNGKFSATKKMIVIE